jgi:hypothetical protein
MANLRLDAVTAAGYHFRHDIRDRNRSRWLRQQPDTGALPDPDPVRSDWTRMKYGLRCFEIYANQGFCDNGRLRWQYQAVFQLSRPGFGETGLTLSGAYPADP